MASTSPVSPPTRAAQIRPATTSAAADPNARTRGRGATVRRYRFGTLRLVEPEEGFFGERVAATYDEDSAGMFDPAVIEPALDRLAELAGDGTALEFAVGTGRIALPLAERGVRVVGMDSSRAMLARLREKP